MIVQDLRGEAIRQESNTHSGILEEKVARLKTCAVSPRIVGAAKAVYNFGETTGAGYLAGYIASGGNHDVGVQCAEYAATFWAGSKIFLGLPLGYLCRAINRNLLNPSIETESAEAEALEQRGQFHRYTPRRGLSLEHSPLNQESVLANVVSHNYCAALDAAHHPVRSFISNGLQMAGGFFLTSLMLDVGNNVLDWVGPNLIEKGLGLAHYVGTHLQPVSDRMAEVAHHHTGDFNQLHMAGIGLVLGGFMTARHYAAGKIQKFRARRA